MDGVLVDSEQLHWESVIDVLVELKRLSPGERIPERIGWGDAALWSELRVTYELKEEVEQLIELRASYAERRLIERPPPPIRGSKEGLRALKARYPDLRLVVVSASPLRHMELSLRSYAGLFEGLVSGIDHCKLNKPSPEPYLTAMSGLGLEPEACAIIEDSPTGLQSALTSGAKVWCLGDAPGTGRFTPQLQGRLSSIEELKRLP